MNVLHLVMAMLLLFVFLIMLGPNPSQTFKRKVPIFSSTDLTELNSREGNVPKFIYTIA